MYYPYFRGKQFELLTIREMADCMASADFVPIIEPVKHNIAGLDRALGALADAGCRSLIIVNPQYGDFRHRGEDLEGYLHNQPEWSENVTRAFALRTDTSLQKVSGFLKRNEGRPVALVHSGFREAKALPEVLSQHQAEVTHLFESASADALYRKRFRDSTRIRLQDGFERKKNADYPAIDSFSSLHVTYDETGFDGFGDYLTVGDDYSEGGGPAYAVAIHLTFIDPNDDDRMYVYHFVSDDNDTPVDPANKFRQALEKLVRQADFPHSHLMETGALQEFRELHERQHFPGLGHIKKLSMKHHIETLADYVGN